MARPALRPVNNAMFDAEGVLRSPSRPAKEQPRPSFPEIAVPGGTTMSGHTSYAEVDGIRYQRVVIVTPWLTPDDDLAETVRTFADPIVESGDTVVVSEKVAILLTGRSVPIDTVRPGRLAQFLAARVQPRQGSRGLSLPEKMQYVLDRTGVVRVLVATAAAALTRPLGIHGVFYRVAGGLARDIDGGRPPFEHLLLPPLEPRLARELCDHIERRIGTGVAIVDINDYGGRVRATSRHALPAHVLARALRDNPLGQRDRRTPIGVVRRVGPAPTRAGRGDHDGPVVTLIVAGATGCVTASRSRERVPPVGRGGAAGLLPGLLALAGTGGCANLSKLP